MLHNLILLVFLLQMKNTKAAKLQIRNELPSHLGSQKPWYVAQHLSTSPARIDMQGEHNLKTSTLNAQKDFIQEYSSWSQSVVEIRGTY